MSRTITADKPVSADVAESTQTQKKPHRRTLKKVKVADRRRVRHAESRHIHDELASYGEPANVLPSPGICGAVLANPSLSAIGLMPKL